MRVQISPSQYHFFLGKGEKLSSDVCFSPISAWRTSKAVPQQGRHHPEPSLGDQGGKMSFPRKQPQVRQREIRMASPLVPNASSPSWLCGDVNKTVESVAFLIQKIRETGFLKIYAVWDRVKLLIYV